MEKYWGRRVGEESGVALIYGSAFATQLVLSVLFFQKRDPKDAHSFVDVDDVILVSSRGIWS